MYPMISHKFPCCKVWQATPSMQIYGKSNSYPIWTHVTIMSSFYHIPSLILHVHHHYTNIASLLYNHGRLGFMHSPATSMLSWLEPVQSITSPHAFVLLPSGVIKHGVLENIP